MKLLSWIGWRVVVFAAALAALELYLGSLGYGKWVVQERVEHYWTQMLPDQDGWSKDLTVPLRINNFGFRDRDWEEAEADDGVFRVAVVGNSMTYGTGVPIEETWPRVLEDRLREHFRAAGDPREPLVMSFAVQAYLFEFMARTYEGKIRPFRPEVLIVPHHPLDVLPAPPTFSDVDYRFRHVYMRTALYDYLNRKVIGRWIPRPASPDSGEMDRINQLKFRFRDDLWAAETRGLWKDAGERMSEVRRQVEEDGGRLALVMLPILDFAVLPRDTTVEPMEDSWEFWARWALSEEARATRPVTVVKPFDAFFAQQERLTAELRRLGALPMAGNYRTVPPGIPHRDESLFLHEDVGHFSVRGHRILGELVFEGLREAGYFE